MPVLSPADLFIGQGLHLYKHVCSEFSRAAHLLEFRRHITKRYDDEIFWQKVRVVAERNPRAPAALGLVILLISKVMGDFAPATITSWTVSRLPEAARLWVDLYGERSVFGDHPGSKLYLLLEREMETAGVQARRPLCHVLLPRGLPPAIEYATLDETLAMRVGRYGRQLRFIWFRLRFHAVEGRPLFTRVSPLARTAQRSEATIVLRNPNLTELWRLPLMQTFELHRLPKHS